jgi:four helix bundle protein
VAVLHYRDLAAWQRGMDLVEAVYRLSACFPPDERFGLTNQIRRAAVSVPSNVAEGQGRGIGREFAHHLRIANGSRQEVETQTLIAVRLGFVSDAQAAPVLGLCDECGRITTGLLRSVTGN